MKFENAKTMKASQINEILLQNHRGPNIIQTFCVGNFIVKKTFNNMLLMIFSSFYVSYPNFQVVFLSTIN
jgi:hypothetical protein